MAVKILGGGPDISIPLGPGPRVDTHPSGEISSFLIFAHAFSSLEIACQCGDLIRFLGSVPVGQGVGVMAAWIVLSKMKLQRFLKKLTTTTKKSEKQKKKIIKKVRNLKKSLEKLKI